MQVSRRWQTGSCSDQVSEEDLHLIRKAVHCCQPVGDERFRAHLESRYRLKLGDETREAGRAPQKMKDVSGSRRAPVEYSKLQV